MFVSETAKSDFVTRRVHVNRSHPVQVYIFYASPQDAVYFVSLLRVFFFCCKNIDK